MKAIKKFLHRLFIDGLSGMAFGLFATLIIGTILQQIGTAIGAGTIGTCVFTVGKIAASLMGAGIDDCAVTKQVHGNVVRVVTKADRHPCMTPVPYEADGIVTAEKGLPIFCFTADCVPALLLDREAGVAGAIHCGWRSSASDILKNAVERMEALGARRERICAAMGPAIGRCCFETDEDVPLALSAYLGGDTEGLWDRKENGKYLVDLRLANKRRLLQLGLREENIDLSDECTLCSHEKYWSHRYTKGNRGSQAACIVLE